MSEKEGTKKRRIINGIRINAINYWWSAARDSFTRRERGGRERDDDRVTATGRSTD